MSECLIAKAIFFYIRRHNEDQIVFKTLYGQAEERNLNVIGVACGTYDGVIPVAAESGHVTDEFLCSEVHLSAVISSYHVVARMSATD